MDNCISSCERELGFSLPYWLRNRLIVDNGWFFDDRMGPSGLRWRFLPVRDVRTKKARKNTAENIVYHTRAFDENHVLVVAVSGAARLCVRYDANSNEPAPELWMVGQNREWIEVATDADVWFDGPKKPVDYRPQRDIPLFTYHQDPVATGAIVQNYVSTCSVCGKQTGWRLSVGAVFDVCPWCVADGSAQRVLSVRFVDPGGLEISPESLSELMFRTPAFFTSREPVWLGHCDDAAVYVGMPTGEQLQKFPDALDMLCESGLPPDYVDMVGPDAPYVAYLFYCRHCSQHLAYFEVV